MATESTARESTAPRQSRVPLAGVGPDQPVRGVFRMGRSYVRLSQRNDPYRIVELVDSSGALRCYGWTAPFVHAAPIPEWSLVDVEFRSYQYQQGVAGRLSALAPAASPTPDDQLETLPATLCPVPGVVGRLIKIVAEIRTPLLREFVARVLADPVLARAFFRVPASFIDHHAWPGGTAEHSVEMASNAADALELLRRRAFDLMLLDEQMPGMRGVALLGMDSVQMPIGPRRALWARLGESLKPRHLATVSHDVDIEAVIEATKPAKKKRIGLVEQTGRGVDKIYLGQLRYGCPAPDYSRSDRTGVRVGAIATRVARLRFHIPAHASATPPSDLLRRDDPWRVSCDARRSARPWRPRALHGRASVRCPGDDGRTPSPARARSRQAPIVRLVRRS
jgi:hypothetical protein